MCDRNPAPRQRKRVQKSFEPDTLPIGISAGTLNAIGMAHKEDLEVPPGTE